jgi:Ca2+-dependent lipid-binding protein
MKIPKFQVKVKYGGQDILGSPFGMNSGQLGISDAHPGKDSTSHDNNNLRSASHLGDFEGKLLVNLVKARNLIKADMIGKSDPYAVLTFGKQKGKTKTVKNTLEPQWDHHSEFNVPDGNADKILIEVFDADKLGKDKSLGKVEVDVLDITADEGRWLPLQGKAECMQIGKYYKL